MYRIISVCWVSNLEGRSAKSLSECILHADLVFIPKKKSGGESMKAWSNADSILFSFLDTILGGREWSSMLASHV